MAMQKISVSEAAALLPEMLKQLSGRKAVVIMKDDVPVARLVLEPLQSDKPKRELGTMRGSVLYMAPDFDAPLEEMKEYEQ
ncbi:type II toxin-antitoxin system Phd/YefM family antitoxin [Lacunimicrobium album]|jgi:antitoxin (DNA-binding transcriptional repressor) of toxin-antitoxin stability system